MNKLILFFCLLSLGSSAQEHGLRILALGDSYTIGESVAKTERWPVQLADSLESHGITVDTVAIIATTGWTTEDLLQAIDGKELEDQGFDMVSLLIGVNDQYQGKPVHDYPDHFRQLLDSAIAYAGGDTNSVFVVSIPDYAFTTFGQSKGEANAKRISWELDAYNAINKSICDLYGVRYFYITDISRRGLEYPALVAGDGLHPSGKQYGLWIERIARSAFFR